MLLKYTDVNVSKLRIRDILIGERGGGNDDGNDDWWAWQVWQTHCDGVKTRNNVKEKTLYWIFYSRPIQTTAGASVELVNDAKQGQQQRAVSMW